MTTLSQPWWLHFSDRAFSFNFTAFSFVMFSCWFPTGFSATFSTLAFLFALPLVFHRLNINNISLFEKIGLVLFLWLSLSILWSEVGILNSLTFLSEYRLYVAVPIFSAALFLSPKTRIAAVYAALVGATVALITSYGLGLGWWKIDGAHLSLGNRIYHGFIMSILTFVTLLIARHTHGFIRICAVLVALMAAYNVINIETGRTGYLLIITVIFTFIALNFSRFQAALLSVIMILTFIFAYKSLHQFNARVDQTLSNVERMIINDDYRSSAGYRLEYYHGAIRIAMDNPFIGVGVGDVEAELGNRFAKKEIRLLTDNVHNEFLNMLVAGGVPALLLFSLFVLSISVVGVQQRASARVIGDILIGVSVIILISAFFNSILKDYGEKHALIIILSILAAKVQELKYSYH